MDYAALKTDILSGPHADTCAALIASGDLDGVARYLNGASGGTIYGRINTDLLLTWGASTGMLAVIQDESVLSGSPLRSSALALMFCMRGSVPSIDFGDAKIIAMLDAWEASGKCSADNKAALLELATKTTSYATANFGRPLTDADIREALKD